PRPRARSFAGARGTRAPAPHQRTFRGSGPARPRRLKGCVRRRPPPLPRSRRNWIQCPGQALSLLDQQRVCPRDGPCHLTDVRLLSAERHAHANLVGPSLHAGHVLRPIILDDLRLEIFCLSNLSAPSRRAAPPTPPAAPLEARLLGILCTPSSPATNSG